MEAKTKSLVEIHTAVFLFGLASLFGKFLALPAITIVLGRVFFATIALLIVIILSKQTLRLSSRKDYFFLALSGLLLMTHWVTFIHSVQISTVAVGLLAYSTFPVFATFVEPYAFKERLRLYNVAIALVTLLGVALIVPTFELGNNVTQGIIWGVVSGFTFALLSVFNRRHVEQYSSLVISFYQNATGILILLPFLFYFYTGVIFQTSDILLLILFGVVFTAVSHSLFIKGLTNVKIQLASIIGNLEPVYGIVFAALILGEVPSIRTVLGGAIILSAAFVATKLSNRVGAVARF